MSRAGHAKDAQTRVKLAYIQTLDETARQEPICHDTLNAEMLRAAVELNSPELSKQAKNLAAGASPSSTGELPGNVAHWPALSPGLRPDVIILEVRDPALLASPAMSRYQAFCGANGIALEILQTSWRKGTRPLPHRKAEVEALLLDCLHGHRIDLALCDRFMFFIALINAPKSPLAGRVFNSHPAPITGALAIKGATPMADTAALYRRGVLSTTESTVHEITHEIDHGEVIATTNIPLDGITGADHLRARFYAGYEALAQTRALKTLSARLGKADWSNYTPIDPADAAPLYAAIVRPMPAVKKEAGA